MTGCTACSTPEYSFTCLQGGKEVCLHSSLRCDTTPQCDQVRVLSFSETHNFFLFVMPRPRMKKAALKATLRKRFSQKKPFSSKFKWNHDQNWIQNLRCPSPHFGGNVTILSVRCDGVEECKDGVDEVGCQDGDDLKSRIWALAKGW